jgi:hypothetical protein
MATCLYLVLHLDDRWRPAGRGKVGARAKKPVGGTQTTRKRHVACLLRTLMCCPPSELPITWIRKSRVVCFPPSHFPLTFSMFLRSLETPKEKTEVFNQCQLEMRPGPVSPPGLPCNEPVS